MDSNHVAGPTVLELLHALGVLREDEPLNAT